MRWPWLITLLLVLAAPSAHALDLSEAAALEPEALAERLQIVDTPEAVVLVLATKDPDHLVIGLREVALAPLEDGSRFVRLVRGQVDGILRVRVERGDLLWEGDLRTLAGRVTVFDVDAALSSPEARGLARDRALRGFDLFAFYGELDALAGLAERRARCQEAMDAMPPGPDRGLVVQACANVDSMTAPRVASSDPARPEAEEAASPVLAPEHLPSSLRDPILFRKDGLSRAGPRGTLPRLGAAVGALLLAGGMTGRAFELEIQGEEAYARYRDAERVGDDYLVSAHLADARTFDAHRDAAITTASLGLAASVALFVWQGVEQRLFSRARRGLAPTIAVLPLRDGVSVAFALDLGR